MLTMARALEDAGHEVVPTVCHEALERCIVKESLNIPVGRTNLPVLCGHCRDGALNMMRAYGVKKTMNLSGVVSSDARKIAAETVGAHVGPLIDFTYEGVRLGRLALFETLFVYKLMNTDLSGEPLEYFKEHLRAFLALYIGLRLNFPHHGFTDIVTYGQYGLHLTAGLAAQKCGARWHTIQNTAHRGVDRRRIMSQFMCSSREMVRKVHALWPRWRQAPLTPEHVEEVYADSLARMQSKSVFIYSPAKNVVGDIRDALGLAHDRRLLVAFTSSPDERVGSDDVGDILGEARLASATNVFPSQAEWLRRLSAWIGGRPDLQLVIRIHPREDANQRDGVRSEHFGILKEALRDLPDNVFVIWPQDQVSSYDLMEAADVVLTSWSNIGLECARLGAPVLTYEEETGTFPVGEFIQGAASWEEYVQKIDRLIAAPPQADMLRAAARYYGLRVIGNSLYIGDVIPRTDDAPQQRYKTPERLSDIARVMGEGVLCAEMNLPTAEAYARTPFAAEHEARTLTRQLKRIVLFFMTGEQNRDDFPLTIRHVGADEWEAAPEPPAGTADLTITGRRCRFRFGATDARRWSPLVSRLARIIVSLNLETGDNMEVKLCA
jgi:hypothetical protein